MGGGNGGRGGIYACGLFSEIWPTDGMPSFESVVHLWFCVNVPVRVFMFTHNKEIKFLISLVYVVSFSCGHNMSEL